MFPGQFFSFSTGGEKNTADFFLLQWEGEKIRPGIHCRCRRAHARKIYCKFVIITKMEICTKIIYMHFPRIMHQGHHHRSRVNSTNTRAAHHKGKVTFIKSGNHHRARTTITTPGELSQNYSSYQRARTVSIEPPWLRQVPHLYTS